MDKLKQATEEYIKSVQDRIKQYPYKEEDLTDNFDINDLARAFEEGTEWINKQNQRYEIAKEILPYCCQTSKELLLSGGKLEGKGDTFAEKVAHQAIMFADALIKALNDGNEKM